MIDVDYNEYKETLAENMKYDLEGVCQDCIYLEKIRPLFEEKDKENKRLNNIINELENIIDIEMNKMVYAKYDSCLMLMKMKIKELKGSESNE